VPGARVSESIWRKAVLDVAELHALDAKVDVSYRAVSAEDPGLERPAGSTSSRAWRSGACADPAATLAALRKTREARRPCHRLDVNRSLKAFAVAIIGAEYIARVCRAGTHGYLKFIRPSGTCAMGPRCGSRPYGPDRNCIQPAGLAHSVCRRIPESNYLAHFRAAGVGGAAEHSRRP